MKTCGNCRYFAEATEAVNARNADAADGWCHAKPPVVLTWDSEGGHDSYLPRVKRSYIGCTLYALIDGQ